MKTKFVILVSLLILQLHTSTSAQTALDSLKQTLLEIETQNILPGFAVAIISPDAILFESGYGFSDLENKKAYTPNTIHNIGSVSKTFIAAAITKCIEDGILSLDTKVNDVLPFKIVHPHFPNEAITLRHLVTHTSGIYDTFTYDKYCYVLKDDKKFSKSKFSLLERLEFSFIAKNKMTDLGAFLKSYLVPEGKFYKRKNFNKAKPGLEYKYSNIASTLAAYMVEIVTDKPFDRYVVDEVIKPLGMESSGYKFDEIDLNQHAVLYSKKGGIIPKYSLITYPDGGVLSSTHDLSIYLQKMMQGYYGESNFISANSYTTLFQKHFEDDKEKSAIFWSINKHGFLNHNGADPGIFTYVQFHPKQNFGMIFTTNCAAHTNKDQFATMKMIWTTMYKKGKNIK